ncbi:MAG: C25 family cysteine peptidase, partial [Candidatus Sumerlaeia bacterium]|nr:C25 family cysteine peptidase [Candidatus Sumerlaeia bacterium]
GFPSGTAANQVVILDITEPYSPILLQNPGLLPDASGGVAVEFEAPAGSSRFALQYLPTMASPDPVALVPLPEPSDILVGNPLRRIYVTYPEFNSSLQPLVNHRGMGTYLLNPQAAFDAFSLGRNDPEALRAALSWVVRESPVRSPLPNVLLVGHSSFDPNNVLGHFSGNQLPVYYEKSFPTTIGELEVAVDYPYSVLLPGDELPDVRLGRVPAKTTSDLDKFVARQLAYEAIGSTLFNSSRGGYLIADVAVEFQDDQPRWQALWTATGRTATLLNSNDSNGAPEKAAIVSALSTAPGMALVLYNGHGNTNRWGGPNIFTATELNASTTQNQWPVVATFTCLNGYYAFPGLSSPSLCELWLFSDVTKGAIANVAPVGVDNYGNQSAFTERFLEAYGTNPSTVGAAFTAALSDFALDFPSNTATRHEFVLFGDPETPLFLNAVTGLSTEDWKTLNH